jgi:DNA-binding IscR family transcriptional regulator
MDALALACAFDRWAATWVVQRLIRSGIVRQRQGRVGGSRLACDPAAITLLRVLEAAERGAVGVEVARLDPDREQFPDCDLKAVAAFHARLDRVCRQTGGRLREYLAGVTLADLLPALAVQGRRGRLVVAGPNAAG